MEGKRVLRIVLKTILILLLAIIAGCIFVLYKVTTMPVVPTDYVKHVKTGSKIEQVYLSIGKHGVKYKKESAKEPMKRYHIYYPEELETGNRTYPIVLFLNGTGIPAGKYPSLFQHLASWGFIVAGNEDPNTGRGSSANQTLAYILHENERPGSVFYHKIDTTRIGISGHSQGGAGVFNAVSDSVSGHYYKAAVSLSPSQEAVAIALGFSYDLTKVKVPMLMLAGTRGDFETKLVIPLDSMRMMYGKIIPPKAMARKTDCDHGQMLYAADGYVTAWFMWLLQGDREAAAAFIGDKPEILSNPLYQSQECDVSGL